MESKSGDLHKYFLGKEILYIYEISYYYYYYTPITHLIIYPRGLKTRYNEAPCVHGVDSVCSVLCEYNCCVMAE